MQVPAYVQGPPETEHTGEVMVPVYPVPQDSVPEVPEALVVAVPPLVMMPDVAAGRRQFAARAIWSKRTFTLLRVCVNV